MINSNDANVELAPLLDETALAAVSIDPSFFLTSNSSPSRIFLVSPSVIAHAQLTVEALFLKFSRRVSASPEPPNEGRMPSLPAPTRPRRLGERRASLNK